MADIISAVYKITNTITGDFYIGSSKNIKERWAHHKIPSSWDRFPNNKMYKDMKKYGTGKFEMQILKEVEVDKLKEAEQQFIEKMQPTYNQMNAKGWDIIRYKEYNKVYREEHKNEIKEYQRQLCFYNDQTITLNALSLRFRRQGILHPTLEAKKYLALQFLPSKSFTNKDNNDILLLNDNFIDVFNILTPMCES